MRVILLLALAVVALGASCPGKCQDTKTPCAGTYQAGKCPGKANIQCCMPKAASTASASKCSGSCQDSSKLPCATGYKAGLCPGASNIKCCPKAPAAANVVPAKKQQPQQQTAVSAGPVTFQKLWSNYPHGETEAVKKRLGGGINAGYITNTCVIRLSHSFILSGKKISPMKLANGQNMVMVNDAQKQAHPIRVKEFKEWMLKQYGQPAVKHVVPSGSQIPYPLPSKFNGKKGVIMFDVRVWNDASGHFDLWDGSDCAHACYFDKAAEVWLWTF